MAAFPWSPSFARTNSAELLHALEIDAVSTFKKLRGQGVEHILMVIETGVIICAHYYLQHRCLEVSPVAMASPTFAS
jgi:hypothetical protein